MLRAIQNIVHIKRDFVVRVTKPLNLSLPMQRIVFDQKQESSISGNAYKKYRGFPHTNFMFLFRKSAL